MHEQGHAGSNPFGVIDKAIAIHIKQGRVALGKGERMRVDVLLGDIWLPGAGQIEDKWADQFAAGSLISCGNTERVRSGTPDRAPPRYRAVICMQGRRRATAV